MPLIVILIATAYLALMGNIFGFIVMLIVYSIFILMVEKGMKSFVGPTKPTIIAQNKDVQDRVIEISNMFLRAENYINIVSKCLKSQVYSSYKVKEALKKAIDENKVIVEIITEEEIDPIVKRFIRKWVKKGAMILYRMPDDLIVSRHFIVVDETEVRIEQPHTDNYEDIKASYWLSYRRLGYHTKKKFEEIKEQAILIKPESF